MIGLVIILIWVLFLPLTVKWVEHNLEIFLLVMGIVAAGLSGVMDDHLIEKALVDPIHITIAVLIAGLFCKWLQGPLEEAILSLRGIVPQRIFFALTITILGLISSMITAIIAALVLAMIINVIRIDRQSSIRFTVLACYSIGLGAALTPIGEPLSTIIVKKLNEDFFYLLQTIGTEVIIAIVIFGVLALFLIKPKESSRGIKSDQNRDSYKEIVTRSLKIYLFVMGLTFLGHGFEPLINEHILGLHPKYLYWMNMVSAILDNATLAAAEISPAMEQETIRAILLGLLISGGMLIPGNIPNIIAAGKLNITSKEWAGFAVPVGLMTMALYFIVIFVFN